MKIEEIINLWNKSNCNTLMIRSMPCVNHKGDITWGTGFYRKGDTICCGKKYKVEDYLKKMYIGSIFMFDYNDNNKDYIVFNIILRSDE